MNKAQSLIVAILVLFCGYSSQVSAINVTTDCTAKMEGLPTAGEVVEEIYNHLLSWHTHQRHLKEKLSEIEAKDYQRNADMIRSLGLIKDKLSNPHPNFEKLISNQNRILNEIATHSDLYKNDEDPKDWQLKLGIPFRKNEGFDKNDPDHWLFLEPHERVPEGFKFAALNGFLPGAALWKSISQGIFPAKISDNLSIYGIKEKGAAHELLGHITTYLLNPTYARAYIKVAKRIMAEYEKHKVLHGRPYWSFIYKTGLFARVYVFNEGLTKSREDVILENPDLFGMDRVDSLPSILDINFRNSLPKNLTEEDVYNTLNELMRLTPKVSIPVGGGALVSTQAVSPYSNFIRFVHERVYKLFLNWSPSADPKAKIKVASSLVSIIRGYHLHMAQIDFEDLADEIFADGPNLSSPMTHFYSPESGFKKELVFSIKLMGRVSLGKQVESKSLLNRFSSHWQDGLPADTVRAK